jgi:hypothetical protein
MAQPKAIDDLKSMFVPALPADAKEVTAAVAADGDVTRKLSAAARERGASAASLSID